MILLNPHVTTAWHLKGISNVTHRRVTLKALAAAQFPDSLSDEHGFITKPSTW